MRVDCETGAGFFRKVPQDGCAAVRCWHRQAGSAHNPSASLPNNGFSLSPRGGFIIVVGHNHANGRQFASATLRIARKIHAARRNLRWNGGLKALFAPLAPFSWRKSSLASNSAQVSRPCRPHPGRAQTRPASLPIKKPACPPAPAKQMTGCAQEAASRQARGKGILPGCEQKKTSAAPEPVCRICRPSWQGKIWGFAQSGRPRFCLLRFPGFPTQQK